MPVMPVLRLRGRSATWWTLAIAMSAMVSLPALAEEPAPTRQEELERAIGEAGAAEVAAIRELAAATDRREAAEAELARIEARLDDAEQRVAAARAASDLASARYFDLYYELEALESRVRDASAARADAAANLYTGSSDPMLDSVVGLTNDDFSDAGARSEYLEVVADRRRADAAAAERGLAELESMRRRAERLKDESDAALALAEDEARALAQLRESQLAVTDELRDAEAGEARLIESIRARKDEYEAELDRLRVDSGSIGDMLAVRQSSQPRGELVMHTRPVPGPIVSVFGMRMHPILGYVRMHQGVDVDANQGDPIAALADGVVVWAGERGGYGNTVIIDHGNQFATLYAHQSQIVSKVGDTVRGGQVIGFIGSTGLSSGPHLHFEVRDLGVPIDPEPYLTT
jgi:murein DD-endopeptidase MepM/ murein hydrolase activator NlpD